MDRHEVKSSQEHVDSMMSTDPPLDANGTTLTPPSPVAICQHIGKLQKLVRFADSRIRFQQEFIDIEMFDRRDTDPVHLESLIREKGSAELEYGISLGELKGLFT
ncbi:hypothetical protein TNCT_674651 [Trichonephila clavata]|uniref:Uncharacterized protein n=1 Tax=Trichonephila clavata TaxID=2740835 RepID=A0A8X6HQR2_TRICU|nr:hypothetical protein TNCT_674651 [Trichonephila clavata]